MDSKNEQRLLKVLGDKREDVTQRSKAAEALALVGSKRVVGRLVNWFGAVKRMICGYQQPLHYVLSMTVARPTLVRYRR